jgi:hypothetical protein
MLAISRCVRIITDASDHVLVREIALNADENVSKQSRSIIATAKLAFSTLKQ